MDNVVIVNMGFEGGGVTIYGRQTDGVWSLWNEGVSMYFDENDEENWRCWSSDPVSELSELLPKEWWQMSPTKVHPEFVAPLRREYERFRSAGARSGAPSVTSAGRGYLLVLADTPNQDLPQTAWTGRLDYSARCPLFVNMRRSFRTPEWDSTSTQGFTLGWLRCPFGAKGSGYFSASLHLLLS